MKKIDSRSRNQKKKKIPSMTKRIRDVRRLLAKVQKVKYSNCMSTQLAGVENELSSIKCCFYSPILT